jgi:Ca2+/H+ antiporter
VQRSINIFLGSVLSTIGLTIPAMIAIIYVTDHPLVLGVEHSDEWLLIVTLGVSIVTFASGPRERHAGLRPSHPVRSVYPTDVPGVRAASGAH